VVGLAPEPGEFLSVHDLSKEDLGGVSIALIKVGHYKICKVHCDEILT
jgi:hypothetical protein